MSLQYPGGLITKTPVTPSGPYETSTASGVWTLDEQAYWQKLGQWPTAGRLVPDPQFNYVTMLLHGDGTNGAQNNTFLDSSTNNFTITRNGNTTQGSFSPYGSNWSNYFDGTGDYLTTSSSQIIPTGSFTVECFVFITGSGNNQKFVSQGTSGTAGRFSVGIEGGNWWVQLGGDAVQTGTPVRNQWNYVAATFNGSTLSIYVNGSLISSVSTSTNAQNTTLTIGQDWNSYTTTGYISNVRVSNTVRTVTTVPTAPFTSDGNTRLLACQANRFLDSSVNAFALTVNGNPSVQRFNPFGASTAYSTSVIGGSGYFDGSGDYLSIATNAALQFGTGDFTFECWIYPSGAAGNEFIADFGATSASGWGLYDEGSGGNMQFRIGDVDRIAVNPLTAGAWSHVAVVRSGTTATLYVNGTSAGSYGSASTNLTYSGTNYIGSQSGSSNYMNGYMSNIRAVKGTAVYTSNFTPSTTPLTAISGTSLLLSTTNGAIFDNAMMNDLETVGNAQISTSVVKYGTGSLYFDGTGDGLFARSTPDTAFNTGDFTVEFWIYLAANLGSFVKIVEMGTTGNCFTIETQSTTNVLTVTNLTSTVYLTSNTALTNNTWIHVAVTRASGTLRIFQNGASVGGVANTVDFPNSGGIYIGQSNSGQAMNGYIDDLRITKGYARYTTTFTPPTAAFPNIGPT